MTLRSESVHEQKSSNFVKLTGKFVGLNTVV
jgi:hypothetical protein